MEARNIKRSDETQGKPSSGIMQYVFGFILAVALTLIAYMIVVHQLLAGAMLIVAIMGLAAVQLLVQLLFFLHFGRRQDEDSRWHQAAFYFMLIVLIVIVGGSLWIMANLNYNMMMPEQMNEYMMKESNKGF